jgi:hypothetical protein
MACIIIYMPTNPSLTGLFPLLSFRYTCPPSHYGRHLRSTQVTPSRYLRASRDSQCLQQYGFSPTPHITPARPCGEHLNKPAFLTYSRLLFQFTAGHISTRASSQSPDVYCLEIRSFLRPRVHGPPLRPLYHPPICLPQLPSVFRPSSRTPLLHRTRSQPHRTPPFHHFCSTIPPTTPKSPFSDSTRIFRTPSIHLRPHSRCQDHP